MVPSGMQRPRIQSSFPSRGTSGYASTLVVEVDHGKGETVLPRGIELQSASDSAKELTAAGFVIPDQDGGAPARVQIDGDAGLADGRVRTRFEFPLLVLPKEPGRQVLVLPPLPIAVARASGEIATVCTRSHSITVEDPTAGLPNAEPKHNPPFLMQREEWTTLRRAMEYGSVGVLAGALLAYAMYRYNRRPKPVPPPPPPRPPWEVALERLDEVRHAGLLGVGRYSEYFDRVNDAMREYLGARYGFDGLESTTDETINYLKAAPTFGVTLPEIASFLQECDLVKFANMTPTEEECGRVLLTAEAIVRRTMPTASGVRSVPPPAPPTAPPTAPAPVAPTEAGES
jgi:hypothetical protein